LLIVDIVNTAYKGKTSGRRVIEIIEKTSYRLLMIVIMKFQTRKRMYSAAVCSLSASCTLLFRAHLLGGLFPSLT